MPHSPRTPTRSRLSSGVDFSFVSASPQSHGINPQFDNYNSPRPLLSHRTSLYSIPSPSNPQPPSSHDRRSSFGMANGFGGVPDQGGGLGNLADELAEAWDDDGHGELEEGGFGVQADALDAVPNGPLELSEGLRNPIDTIETNAELATSPICGKPSNPSLSPTKRRRRPKHQRQLSRYGGSDYGHDSDLDEDVDTPLLAWMAAIENLARQGLESNGSEPDPIVQRFANSLKDLGSQSGLENGTTRLITAHVALAAHLTHQARLIQTISPRLFPPLSPALDSARIDPLLPLLSSLSLILPSPNPQSLRSLLHLHSSTSDLLSTLSALSDTLHMTRQTASLASRRLKAARETVEEMKRDAQTREDGMNWVEKGRWNDRLAGRECARVCQDVVGGFEEVCKGWREKLTGTGTGIGAPEMEVCAG